MACSKKQLMSPNEHHTFACALANHRYDLKLYTIVSQSAAQSQMLSHYITVKPFPAPQIFMTHSSPNYFSFKLQSLYNS